MMADRKEGRNRESVTYFVSWRVLWPTLPPVVRPSRRDVSVTEPFLYLRNVRSIVERIGCGRRACHVRAARHAELSGVAPHDFVHAIGGE